MHLANRAVGTGVAAAGPKFGAIILIVPECVCAVPISDHGVCIPKGGPAILHGQGGNLRK